MKRKTCFRILVSIVVMCSLLRISGLYNIRVQAATLEDISQDQLFVKQQVKGTCTLASSVMMLRRTAMLSGKSDWSNITEQTLRPTAWIEGTGLRHEFTYQGMKVKHERIPGDIVGEKKKEFYIKLLEQHPEGIVIYREKVHAVLLTDYTNGEFYCADPAMSASRIPISKSKQVTIESTTRYWYVTSPKVTLENIAQLVFDGQLYAQLYPELITDYGYTINTLYDHWIKVGMKEGRTPSIIYQPQFYLDANPLLQAKFGTDYEALFWHFATYGAFENRASSPVYDASYYRNGNPDLKSLSSLELLKHFLNKGIKEYRTSSRLYDGRYYLSRNADLKGYDSLKLINHFIITGLKEYRESSLEYNGGYYKDAYADFSQYDSAQLAMYYANHGYRRGDIANSIDLSVTKLILNQSEFIYTGKEIKPGVTLTYQNTTLKAGSDYIVSYKNNIKIGNGTIIITGQGKYAKSITKSFVIRGEKLSGVNISGTSSTYDGKTYAPQVTLPKGAAITYSTDGKTYRSTKPSYLKAGTYKVFYKVTKTNYQEVTGNVTIKILPKSIHKMNLSLSSNRYIYNGKERRPTVVLKNGKVTISSANYTILYTSNINPGVASVKIIGKGNYSGSITKTFLIQPSAPKASAAGLTKGAKVNWGKVTGASGYEVYMSSNRKKGFAKICTSSSMQSYQKTGLIKNRTYYFKVRAYTKVGKQIIYSSYSSITSGKVR